MKQIQVHMILDDNIPLRDVVHALRTLGLNLYQHQNGHYMARPRNGSTVTSRSTSDMPALFRSQAE